MDKVSELQTMKSAAGWYAGTAYWDEEMGGWFPNSRESGYYYTRWEVLLRCIGQDISPDICKEAGSEVSEELAKAISIVTKAKGGRKALLKKRIEFLKKAKEAFESGMWPTEHWDYSIMC